MKIHTILQNQTHYFMSGQTKSYHHRIQALYQLKHWINHHEQEICDALYQDLRKSSSESYMSEIGIALSELNFHIKHLKKWMKPTKVPTPLSQFYSRSFYQHEPYGKVLIMAPWNYPFLLCIEPLIGAISAGNCIVLKPSAYAPHTSSLLSNMIKTLFSHSFIYCIEGGRNINSQLLEERFDYIFFTGSVNVGKLVMEKASKYLTPVTLELGGKSPCIIAADANIKIAAKRIVFGKFLNSGQTCVAPDYLLVDQAIKVPLILEIQKQIEICFGKNPLKNPHLPSIINEKHFIRLISLLQDQTILYGGNSDYKNRLIAPTLIELDSPNHFLMKDEIFGPILPILSYSKLQEAISIINAKEKPLALYLFTESNKIEKQVMSQCSFGGGCINDTIVHLVNPYFGFGGVGNSGMGSYHGYESFRTFSHRRSIMKKSTKLDLPFRYPPYQKTKDRFIRLFLK